MGGHSGGVICGQLVVAIGRPLEPLLKLWPAKEPAGRSPEKENRTNERLFWEYLHILNIGV